MNIVHLSITLHCCIRSPHLLHFKTKAACIWIPKNHVNYIDFLHLLSNIFEFGMTGPLNESISCFLIRVDPSGLHVLTFRGLHTLAFRGLHILAFRGLHALTFRGLHVLTFRGLHVLTCKRDKDIKFVHFI